VTGANPPPDLVRRQLGGQPGAPAAQGVLIGSIGGGADGWADGAQIGLVPAIGAQDRDHAAHQGPQTDDQTFHVPNLLNENGG